MSQRVGAAEVFHRATLNAGSAGETEEAEAVRRATLISGTVQAKESDKSLMKKPDRKDLQVALRFMMVVSTALSQLEHVLEERQRDLTRVAGYTTEVNEYVEHDARDGTSVQSLDQRDAMPKKLWAWSEHGPTPMREGMALAQDAFALATNDPARSAAYATRTFNSDLEVFAHGALHVLALYAERVDVEFRTFMRNMFGERFRGAPVKKIARMMTKLRQDLEEDRDDGGALAAAWDDPGLAAASTELRAYPYRLADLVRGSVTADGADAMLEVAEKLRVGAEDGEGRGFVTWRVKNTHHSDADVVGGYRDVKMLGKFSAAVNEGETLAMIVELQIIDATFLAVKKHMHKPFTIARGDFW